MSISEHSQNNLALQVQYYQKSGVFAGEEVNPGVLQTARQELDAMEKSNQVKPSLWVHPRIHDRNYIAGL